MAALGAIPAEALAPYCVLGELGLDGTVAPVAGVLPAAMAANALALGLVCPASSGPEAAWASGEMEILAPLSLIQLANHFRGTQRLARPEASVRAPGDDLPDMRDIRGQAAARRALEVAAAGGHNLLMSGPPGSGKSMLAARLPSILPALAPAELLEVSMVASIAGELGDGRLTDRRPFRAPHHSASMAAMVGGGARARPGEASLSHRGVLFLDELPEFSPAVLDSLRQPIESGECVIARANHRVTYPARFQLVAAMNPCRCGLAGEPGRSCARGPRCAADYQARVSGPFLDRVDIRVEVPAVRAVDLLDGGPCEDSAAVRSRVEAARARQGRRYAALGLSPATPNAHCPAALLERVAAPDEGGARLLREAAERLHVSARAFHRILKVARTLADLAGAERVGRAHLAEAIGYRVGAGT